MGCQPKPPLPLCKPNEYSCFNGWECISKSLYCDGTFHCSDRSDETNCPTLVLRAYPSEQTIEEGREIVFQCRDEGPLRARVEWRRQSLPLPPGKAMKSSGLLSYSDKIRKYIKPYRTIGTANAICWNSGSFITKEYII